MTDPERILEAGKQIEAIAHGRARKDKPEASADRGRLPADGKLTAIPNEATVEAAKDPA